MRAVQIRSHDGPGAVVVTDVAEPVAGPGQVLIEVSGAGISFPDVLHTRGAYQVKPPLPFVPGWEVSGTIDQGDGRLTAGQRVCAIATTGGFAERVAVDAEMVFALPDGVDLVTAAAVPLNYLTAHFALVRRARMVEGDTLLVHGAAGGVGSAVCQLGAALGATVLAVVSSEAKGELALRAGARHVLSPDTFRDEVRILTGGRGVDVVVDPVGGDRLTDSLRSLAPEGRLLTVGFAAGDIPSVRLNRLLLGNISVLGVGVAEWWRHDRGFAAEQWRALSPLLGSGAIAPLVTDIVSLDGVAAALTAVEERGVLGKVVVRLS